MRSGPKKDTRANATWEEVWYWGREISKEWGYDVKVSVYPPLSGNPDVRFVVLVELKSVRFDSPFMGSTITKWRNVQNKELTAEFTALQLIVEMHRDLDNEALDRERAALVQGALL